MKIKTNFTTIPREFSKGAAEKDVILGNPVRSFPFRIEEIPENTKAIAFSLIDYDAVPVCSFPWIHWLIADFETSDDHIEIPENASVELQDSLIQGKNSFSTPLLEQDFSEIETLYVGPTPPDKDHRYTLTVYALSQKLNFENGLFLNDLLFNMQPYLLDSTSVELIGLK